MKAEEFFSFSLMSDINFFFFIFLFLTKDCEHLAGYYLDADTFLSRE